MDGLPQKIDHVSVPPIKCQGIKTKLVPFIFSSVQWDDKDGGRWVEPFLGSGVVALNLAPQRALLTDTNRHIIGFYKAMQQGNINRITVQEYLAAEGKKLELGGADYYYKVRERFNKEASPFDFLFLNRSCFNGLMRFNRRGEFNTPFGHKPQRFTKSYVTKISNQIGWVVRQMQGKDWEFRVAPWDQVLSEAAAEDFVYIDPPYIGRHADYYNSWDMDEAIRLSDTARNLPCGFALSMWLENKYRRNEHISECWSGLEMRVCSHFYHVGASEELRNQIDEALIIKPGFATPDFGKQQTVKEQFPKLQLSLAV